MNRGGDRRSIIGSGCCIPSASSNLEHFSAARINATAWERNEVIRREKQRPEKVRGRVRRK